MRTSNQREEILAAAIGLIERGGDRPEEVTVREICAAAGVGVGLINYHFGSKEQLISVCVRRMIEEIVSKFEVIREQVEGKSPFEKLEFLSLMTLEYLFVHPNLARISILGDLSRPSEGDNTSATIKAYLPLICACRPELGRQEAVLLTCRLVYTMQTVFLRAKPLAELSCVSLEDRSERKLLHHRMLAAIMDGTPKQNSDERNENDFEK